MTAYLFTPQRTTALVDGVVAFNMDYIGFNPAIVSLNWNGTSGNINYVDGSFETITDLTPYQSYADYADSIILAQASPVTYYYYGSNPTSIDGQALSFGDPYYSTIPGYPMPPETTALVPPSVEVGQELQWTGSAWVVASFPYSQTLSQAQATLTKEVNVLGAAAVNGEVSQYSTVQQIEAPTVGNLDSLTYPGTTIGEYQTYVDGVVASGIATINAATTVEDLYTFNPSSLPYTPAATGTIFTGRGSGLGPLDMNVSYFTVWTSTTVDETDTELFIPGTNTVIPYGSGGPGQFDSTGNCFVIGNYTVQVRQASTGFVLAQYECPFNLAGESVNF